MSKHNPLGPSSFERRALCPGSLAAEAGRPERTSDAAELGTHAHSALEYCVDKNVDPMECVGGWFHDRDLEADTAVGVKVAWDYIQSISRDERGRLIMPVHTEVWVNPDSLGRDDMAGTSDVILWNPEQDMIEVCDYKNGRKYVDAAGNMQMLIYLIGALNTLKITHWPRVMRTTIMQPNSDGDAIRSCDYTEGELQQWTEYFVQVAAATDDPNAPRTPGAVQCHYCKARGDCNEQAEGALAAAREVFAPVMIGSQLSDGIDKAKILALNPEAVQAILMSKSFIVQAYKDVEEFAHGRLSKGFPVPGFKLVKGRNTRGWAEEPENMEVIFRRVLTSQGEYLTINNYRKSSLVSPAQAEAQIKPWVSDDDWEKISTYITSKIGKPQLVPEGHSKPAVNMTPEEAFGAPAGEIPDFLT